MDRNTELLLQKASRVLKWEDEEKASYDLELLEEEFCKRLYGQKSQTPSQQEQDDALGKKE